MTTLGKMQRFAENFPDIQVTVNEIGNLNLRPRNTERELLLQPIWMGWDEQTSTATDLRFSLVEQDGEKYGRYDFNPFTEELEVVSFAGQPTLNETVALAQRGVSAVQAYRELPSDIQSRARGIVNDKSSTHTLSERLNSSEIPDGLLGLNEMSASERFLFFKTMLGDLALKHL